MRIERDGERVTVFAEGRIDANNAPQFAADMETAIEGTTDLTIECTGLEYISSSGLRAVMLALKTMGDRGQIRITGVNDYVYTIFEVTGFTAMMEIGTAK